MLGFPLHFVETALEPLGHTEFSTRGEDKEKKSAVKPQLHENMARRPIKACHMAHICSQVAQGRKVQTFSQHSYKVIESTNQGTALACISPVCSTNGRQALKRTWLACVNSAQRTGATLRVVAGIFQKGPVVHGPADSSGKQAKLPRTGAVSTRGHS